MKNILSILMLSLCATFVACSDSDGGDGNPDGGNSVYVPLPGRKVASVKTTSKINGRDYSWEHKFTYDAQGRIKEINSEIVHHREYNYKFFRCNMSSNAKYRFNGNELEIEYSVARMYPDEPLMNSKENGKDRGAFNQAGVLSKFDLADFVYSGTSLNEAYFETGERFEIKHERGNVVGYVVYDIADDKVKADFSHKYGYSSIKNKTNFDFSGYFGCWGVESNVYATRMPYYASYQLAAFGMLGATSTHLPISVYNEETKMHDYGEWELDSKDCPILYTDPSGRKTTITYVD